MASHKSSRGRDTRPRLFVGLAVPQEVAARLEASQTAGGHGIRNVLPADFHLTLHFLGAMDADEVAAALARVTAHKPRIHLRGLGQFRMRDGRRILWAGVEANDRLLALQAAVARSLEYVGYLPERRPYLPHVTLARVSRGAAGPALDAHVAAGSGVELGEFEAAAFHLFNTAAADAPNRYLRLRSWALAD